MIALVGAGLVVLATIQSPIFNGLDLLAWLVLTYGTTRIILRRARGGTR